jgi:hypothetical protein
VRVVEQLLFVAFIQSVVVDGKELNLGVDSHAVAAIFPKSSASPAGAARRPAVLWMVFVMIALPVVEVDRSRPRLCSHSPARPTRYVVHVPDARNEAFLDQAHNLGRAGHRACGERCCRCRLRAGDGRSEVPIPGIDAGPPQ